MQEPGLLDRIINPTLGVIQQPLWRLWRVLKDEDVDFFDPKGMWDPHLLPLVGMAFDPKNTVMPDELFGDNLGTQIAGSILTDPLSFLTSGATAGAKLGKAFNKNFVGRDMTKKAIRDRVKKKAAYEARKKAAKEVGEDFTEELLEVPSGREALYRAAAHSNEDMVGAAGGAIQTNSKAYAQMAQETNVSKLKTSLEDIVKNKGKLLDAEGNQIGEALQDFELDSVRQLLKDMGGIGAEDFGKLGENSLLEVLNMGKQREMGVGIPLLGDFFGMYAPVNAKFQAKHGDWMRWYFTTVKNLYKYTGKGAVFLPKLVADPVLSTIPGIRVGWNGTKSMLTDLAAGWKSGDIPEGVVDVIKGEKSIDDYKGGAGERDVHLGEVSRAFTRPLAVDMDGSIKSISNSGLEASDHVDLFLNQLDIGEEGHFEAFKKLYNEDEWDQVAAYLGLDSSMSKELQREALRDGMLTNLNQIADAQANFARPDLKWMSQHGEGPGRRTAYSFQTGLKLRRWTNLVFKSDLGVSAGKEVQILLNNWKAASSQHVTQTAEDLYAAVAQVVKDSGLDAEVVQELHSALIGLAPLQQELDIFFKQFSNPFKPIAQTMEEYQEWFGSRVNSHLETLIGIASDRLGLQGPQLDQFQKMLETLSYNRKTVALSEIEDLVEVIPGLSRLTKHMDGEGQVSISKIREVLAAEEGNMSSTQYQGILKRLNLSEHQLYHTEGTPLFHFLESQDVTLDKVGVFGTSSAAVDDGIDPLRLMFSSKVTFGDSTLKGVPIATLDAAQLKSAKGLLLKTNTLLKKVSIKGTDPVDLKSEELRKLLGTDTQDPDILKQRLALVQEEIDADLKTIKAAEVQKSIDEDYVPKTRAQTAEDQLQPSLTRDLEQLGTRRTVNPVTGVPEEVRFTLDDMFDLAPSLEDGANTLSRTMKLHQSIMAKQAMIKKWQDLHGTTSGVTGQGLPPSLLNSLKEDIELLRIEMQTTVGSILDTDTTKSGTALIELMDKVRNESLSMGLREGILGQNLPLSYMHRVMSGKQQEIINKVINTVSPDITAKIQGTNALRILETRSERAMSIRDINEVTNSFNSLDTSHESVKEVLKVMDEMRVALYGSSKIEKYSFDPVAATVAHISELHKVINERKWFRFITSEKGHKMGVFGGRVVRVTRNYHNITRHQIGQTTSAELVQTSRGYYTVKEGLGQLVKLKQWVNGKTFPAGSVAAKKLGRVKGLLEMQLAKPGLLSQEGGIKQIDEALAGVAFVLEDKTIPGMLRSNLEDLKKGLEDLQTNPPDIETTELVDILKGLGEQVDEILKPTKRADYASLKKQITELEKGISTAKRTGDIAVERTTGSGRVADFHVSSPERNRALLDALENAAGPNEVSFDLLVPRNYWVVDKHTQFQGARKGRELLKALYDSGELDETSVLMLREAFRYNPKHLASVDAIETQLLELTSKDALLRRRTREEWGTVFNERSPRNADYGPTPTGRSAPVQLEEGGGKLKHVEGDPNLALDPTTPVVRSTDETGGAVRSRDQADATRTTKLVAEGEPITASLTASEYVKQVTQEMNDALKAAAGDADKIRDIKETYAPFLKEVRARQARNFAGQLGQLALRGTDEGAHIRMAHAAMFDDMGVEDLTSFIKKHFDVEDLDEARSAAQDPDTFIKLIASNVVTGKGIEHMEEIGLGSFARSFRETVTKIIDFVLSQLGMKPRAGGRVANRETAEQLNALVRGVLDIDGDTPMSYAMTYRAKRRVAAYNQEYWQGQFAKAFPKVGDDFDFKVQWLQGQVDEASDLIRVAEGLGNKELLRVSNQLRRQSSEVSERTQKQLARIEEAEDVRFWADNITPETNILDTQEGSLLEDFLTKPVGYFEGNNEQLLALEQAGISPSTLRKIRGIDLGMADRPLEDVVEALKSEAIRQGRVWEVDEIYDELRAAVGEHNRIAKMFNPFPGSEAVDVAEQASRTVSLVRDKVAGSKYGAPYLEDDMPAVESILDVLSEAEPRLIKKFGIRSKEEYQRIHSKIADNIQAFTQEQALLVADMKKAGDLATTKQLERYHELTGLVRERQQWLTKLWAKETPKIKKAVALFKADVMRNFGLDTTKHMMELRNVMDNLVKNLTENGGAGARALVKLERLSKANLSIENMHVLQKAVGLGDGDLLSTEELLDLQEKLLFRKNPENYRRTPGPEVTAEGRKLKKRFSGTSKERVGPDGRPLTEGSILDEDFAATDAKMAEDMEEMSQTGTEELDAFGAPSYGDAWSPDVMVGEGVTLTDRQIKAVDAMISPAAEDVPLIPLVGGGDVVPNVTKVEKEMELEILRARGLHALLDSRLDALRELGFHSPTTARGKKITFKGYPEYDPEYSAYEMMIAYVPTDLSNVKGKSLKKLLAEFADDEEKTAFLTKLLTEESTGAKAIPPSDLVGAPELVKIANGFLDDLIQQQPRVAAEILGDGGFAPRAVVPSKKAAKSLTKLKKSIADVEKLRAEKKGFEAALTSLESEAASKFKAATSEIDIHESSWHAHEGKAFDIPAEGKGSYEYLRREKNRLARLKANSKNINDTAAVKTYDDALKSVADTEKALTKRLRQDIRDSKATVLKKYKPLVAKLSKLSKVKNDFIQTVALEKQAAKVKKYNLNPELISESLEDSHRIYGAQHEGMVSTQAAFEPVDYANVDPATGRTVPMPKYYEELNNSVGNPAKLKRQLDRQAITNTVKVDQSLPGASGLQADLENINTPPHTQTSAASGTPTTDEILPEEGGVAMQVRNESRESEKAGWSVHLQQEDGSIVEVNGDVFNKMGHSVATFGRGDTLDAATSARVREGRTGEHFAGNTLTPETVTEQLLDHHISVGPEQFNKGIQNSLNLDIPSNQAGMLRAYDSIHGVLKMLATGLRLPLDFHAANIISSIPMAAMEGVGVRRMIQGMLHTARLLTKDFSALGLDDMSALIHTGALNPRERRLLFSKVLSGSTIHELAAMGRRGAAGAELKGISNIDEELLFRDSFGRGHTYPEMMTALVDNGALGTAMRADQMNILADVGAVKGIREKFLESGGVKGAGRKVVSGAQQFAESSELFVRISMMHAALDTGMSLDEAAKAVSDAMLNYADTTNIEKQLFKRGTFFYTYPRKMVPRALSYMFKNPSKSAAMVNGILKPLAHSGDMVTSEGRPELVIGDYRVNLARLNPNVDALITLGAMADFLAPGTTDHMRELSGDAPLDRPLGPAPLAGVAGWQEFFPNEDPLQVNTTWLEETARLNWVTKLMTQSSPILGSNDPQVSYSMIESAARLVLPFREVRPGQEAGRSRKRIMFHRADYIRRMKSAEAEGRTAEREVLGRRVEQMNARIAELEKENPEIKGTH